jgi:ferritin-like metal-binding protein YciE
MSVDSLEKLLVHDLKDLYSAEKQLLEALPKMAKAASDAELKKAFQTHEKQTQEHVRRIESIFEALEGSPSGKRCKGMEGLIEEGKEIIEEEMPEGLRDAGLIGAAQKVEHYEIAAYGTAREMAGQLGLEDAVEVLQQTLDEESKTDELLTAIAQRLTPAAQEAA